MIDYCIDQARLLPIVRGHKRLFAVVLDKRNRLVSQGSNSYTKTSSRQYRAAIRVGEPAKQCLHAEAVAIFRSKGRGVKLVVARVDAKGNACISKPCRVCCELIKMHGGIISVEHTI